MDIFRDISGEREEPHPTQLVRGVLGLDTQRIEGSGNGSLRDTRHALDGTMGSDEFSTDSFIPPARSSAHQYQYHDLATQTQDLQETMLIDSGSQKENTPTSSEHWAQMQQDQCHKSPSSATSSVKPSFKSATSRNDPSACRNKCPANTGMLPAQPSPHMPVPSHAYITTSQVNRDHSQSPLSQDSFGGAVSQDPVQQFLTSNKQFHAPLSDVGQSSTQSIEEESPEETGDSGNGGYSFIHAAMNAYAEQKVEEALADGSDPSILLAATPSFNNTSRSQSQIPNDPQHSGQATGSNGTGLFGDLDSSQESTQPFDLDQGTSSLERSLDRIIADEAAKKSEYPIIPPELESTQPDTPTQPNDTSQSTNEEPEQARAGPQVHPNTSLVFVNAEGSATNRSRNPSRGLLANANPHRKRKIEHLRREIRENNLTFSPHPLNSHAFTNNPVVETQPSVSPNTQTMKGSNVGSLVESGGPRQLPIQYFSRDHNLNDDDDVVPDSEPPQAGLQSPSPRSSRLTRQASSKKRALTPLLEDRPPSPAAETDLEQTSDEDEDPPLIKMSQFHSTKGKARAIPRQDQHPTDKSATTSKRKPRSRQTFGNAVKRRATGRKHTAPLDAEKSDDETGSIYVPCKVDEEGTEGVEDAMDVDGTESFGHAESLEPPCKRSRVAETRSTRKVSRVSTRKIKQSSTPGIVPPSIKRVQSLASSSRAIVDDITRVFALWKQDGHYYSGYVHDTTSSGRYVVKFDDQTEDTVDISKMRRGELRVGDDVIFASKNSTRGKVENVQQLPSTGLVQVRTREGTLSQGDIMDVRLSDIMIAGRSISSHWKDRVLRPSDLVTAIRRTNSLVASPSPSKLSVYSATSTKSSRLLAKTGFVVTTSRVSKNPDRDKEHIIRAIKRHGGVYIDEWSNLFTMEGSHEVVDKRWFATQEHLQWKGSGDFDIERVFLLSDDASQKSKYLLALALGIPCLSFEWLLGDNLPTDWQPYLLPAGFSEALEARVSQLVDLDWGNSPEYLSDIMSNNVAAKVFRGKDILCLDQAFVSSKGRKRKQDVQKSLEASRSVPWIVLAMGARRVETASDMRQLSKDELKFDYIILKDLDSPQFDLNNCQGDIKVVDVPWVKDCLITGRIMPISK